MARRNTAIASLTRLVPLLLLTLGLTAAPPELRPMPDSVKRKLSRQAAGPRY